MGVQAHRHELGAVRCKLTASDEEGAAELGTSVALSADGTLALAGGPADDAGLGAAWTFSSTGGAFSQQGPKLTGGGESGAGEFGRAVALAGDGLGALIGAPADEVRPAPPGASSAAAAAGSNRAPSQAPARSAKARSG